MCGNGLVIASRTTGRTKKTDGAAGLVPPIMLALPRCHLHHSWLVQCAAWARSAYRIATRLLAKRIVVSCRRHRRHPRPELALPVRGQDVLESMKIRNAVCGALRLSASSWPPLAVQYVFKRVYCIPLPASSMDRVAGMAAVDTMENDTEAALFAIRRSSRRRTQSPFQYVTRQNFRRHLRGRWTRQSVPVREIEWRICGRRVQMLRLVRGPPSPAETILYEETTSILLTLSIRPQNENL